MLFVCGQYAKGQELFDTFSDSTTTASAYQMKPNSEEVEINILSGYYDQDGNHSPVTGGIGTEKLNDFANTIIINVPLDKANSIGLFGGADAYSSASTDNIDSNVSSASSDDVRGYGTISYNHKNLNRNEIYGLRAGFSKEYDYISFSAGFSLTKEWNEGNTELNFTGQAFLDQWLGKENVTDPTGLIYPEMWLLPFIYGDNYFLQSNKRNSFNGQLFLSQVITTRLQLGLSAEIIYMNGLLSTPFHTVYFKDKENWEMDIERLPSSRIKLPLGVRANWFPLEFLVLRSYYRYYTDDFGINAHTAEIEASLKLTPSLTLSPFYRYHSQTAAKYFSPYKEQIFTAYHSEDNNVYYTSDYDLSALNSHKFGIGVKYAPNYGILRSKALLGTDGILTKIAEPALEYLNLKPKPGAHGVIMFKYAEIRSAIYSRTPDLEAYNISLNLGFGIK